MQLILTPCLRQKQSLRQELLLKLEIIGGSTGDTETIFPLVERRLRSSSKLQRVISKIRDPHGCNMNDYRSFMDFFVAALFPEARPLIQAFYNDKGLPFRDQVTEEGRFSIEVFMLGALEAATISREQHLTITWDWLRRTLDVLTHELPPVRVYAMGITPLVELADCAA